MQTMMLGRGQPLVALVTLLAGWAGGRVMGWEHIPEPTLLETGTAAAAVVTASRTASGPLFIDTRTGPQSNPDSGYGDAGYGYAAIERGSQAPAAGATFASGDADCRACVLYPGLPVTMPLLAANGRMPPGKRAEAPLVVWNPAGYGWGPSAAGLGGGASTRHADALAPAPARRHADAGWSGAGFSGAGLGAGRASGSDTDGAGDAEAFHAAEHAPGGRRPLARWSGDAWAFLRKGQAGYLAPGVTAASYGSSQAGAAIRFRIDRNSGHRPTAYMRTTSTLGALPESAAALGLSARPLGAVPVYVAVEGRLTQQAGLSRFQPAAMAVTEMPPFELPLGLRGELYAQGGYIGGPYATPFADGQLRLDHGLFSLGPVEARLGGGTWGGVQKGAGRLDVGPGITASFPLKGRTYGRLALDWRKRIAGDALPGDGATLTLSAGF